MRSRMWSVRPTPRLVDVTTASVPSEQPLGDSVRAPGLRRFDRDGGLDRASRGLLGPEHLEDRVRVIGAGGTASVGVDLYYVALDYSKARSDDSFFDGMTFWRLTARVPLASSPDNFWPELLREPRR